MVDPEHPSDTSEVGTRPRGPDGQESIALLCYRCGSHVQDGAEKCWNCGTVLAAQKKEGGPSTAAELRARQRTGSRMFGVVYKIGDLIANRYQVKDIIGSGGAGVVYRAHDQEIDVDVAVKVVNAKLVQTSDEQRLFSRQTKIAKKLSHQNVVRIYDEGRDEQRPYFTMQFLEGLSLRKIIDLRKEKGQTFALSEVEPIFNQLCQALEYAHKTTFHGNLKPDNVIVLPDLLKITDFALLRGLPRKPFLAIQKSRGANFRYLAPEVRLEVPDLDKTTDIYSLGVVLCEMLTGTVYDEGKAEQLSVAGANLEPSVLAVLKRCLNRAPRDRYQSTRALYEDVRAAMSRGTPDRPAVAPPPPPDQHPETAAEAPTQRLDISKHGARPVADDDAEAAKVTKEAPAAPGKSMPPPPPPSEKPAPVEIAADVDLSAERPDEAPEPKREGTASFEIDDDMIEASRAQSQQSAATPPEAPPASSPAISPVAPSAPAEAAEPMAASAAIEDEDLQDDPAPDIDPDEEEEETQALLEPEPALVAAAAALDAPMEEISNSAIELIADPRATNVLRVDREKNQVSSVVPAEAPPTNGTPSNGTGEHATVQPTPLPDSAIPEPAFASLTADATQHGRLDEPSGPSVPAPPPTPPAEPEVGDPGNASRPAKKRPMTRPRMATVQPSAIPAVSTVPVGGMGSARPQTMPAMGAATPLGTIPPEAPPPPPANNRPIYFTVAASIGAVVLALIIVLKVSCDQQDAAQQQIAALQAQMTQMQGLAQTARDNQQKLEQEAEKAAGDAEKAAVAAAEAEKAAEAEAAAKAKAEEEARLRAEEAAKAEAAVKAAADVKAREAAEARAAKAQKAAAAQKAEAVAAAKREARARERAEAERARREEAQRRRAEKARRAQEEAEAAAKAEARAKRLAEEEAEKRRVISAASERRAEERKARAEREAERRAADAEAERKRKEEEERRRAEAAREAEEKKAALAAATEAPAEPKCPRGMVLISGGDFMMGSARNDPERNFGDKSYVSTSVGSFCVDYYEYPNGRGLTPKTKVSYKSAVSRCKRKGKRLCSEEEWERACKGKSGTRYPYGNAWDPTRCNTEDEEGGDREIAKSGTFRKCYSGFKVFDMSGNVAEWTSTSWGSGRVVKGGASDRPGYDGRCAARKKKSTGYSSETLGFRCCADPG